MKKKHTAQSAFGNHCIFIGVLAFVNGILLALFASANPPSFVHECARDVGDQFDHSNGAPSNPARSFYQAWVARYNGPGNGFDEVAAIGVDELGNVYVTGTSFGSGTIRDYATIKYNSAGQQEWLARYNGPDNLDDQANAIAVDGLGNVYVTGWSRTADSFSDWATIKYNSD
jgi:Beta-propeller repeat